VAAVKRRYVISVDANPLGAQHLCQTLAMDGYRGRATALRVAYLDAAHRILNSVTADVSPDARLLAGFVVELS